MPSAGSVALIRDPSGAVLFVFTVVTVAVATVPWLDVGQHGFDTADMVLGLAIASVKAGLVAAIFMHLNHEKGTVYFVILTGVVMGLALMLLTAWAYIDPIRYGSEKTMDKFYNPEKSVED